MKIKPLDKRGQENLKLSMSKMIKVTKQNIDYYIFAMKVKDIDTKLTRSRSEKEVTILDKGYMYIQILPINENYSLTLSYDEKGQFIEWYFDITANNFLDERGMPFYEDLYIDIVLTKDKEVLTLDEDELNNAFDSGKITKEQYDLAIREADLLRLEVLENYNALVNLEKKYYNLFFKEKSKEKEDNSNTYRVNIKPGIRVAIVLKKDQKTGILTEGVVKDILTNSVMHHRGIKVRLEDGQVGRVQKILDNV